MAKTTKLRVHLITPKESSDRVRETFHEMFYSADIRSFYPENETDSFDILVSDIIEDREDHRSDIRNLRKTANNEFSAHNVFYTERNSPRNREENPALDYSKDVVIGVCNVEPASPNIQAQVTTDGLKTGNTDPCPVFDDIYVTIAESDVDEGFDLIGIDLEKEEVIWREYLQKSKGTWSNPTKCDHGALVSTGRHDLRLHDPETGSEQWNIDIPYEPEEGMYLRNTSPVPETDRAFLASGDGHLYDISLLDGSFKSIGQFGEAIYEVMYDSTSQTLVMLVGPGSEKRYNSKQTFNKDEIPTLDYSLVAISSDDSRVLWTMELGEFRNQNAAEMAIGDEMVFFSPYDDALVAINILSGDINWRIDQDQLKDSNESDGQGSNSNRSSTSRFYRQLTVSSLISSQGVVFASTSQDLLRISSDNGDIVWKENDKKLLFEQDGDLVCKGDNVVLNSIHGINKETGEATWQFEAVGMMGGINNYDSDLILTNSDECLVINTSN